MKVTSLNHNPICSCIISDVLKFFTILKHNGSVHEEKLHVMHRF